MSKGTAARHRHRWVESTRISDAGTRYECAGCDASYFEPFLSRDPGPDKLYYVKEG